MTIHDTLPGETIHDVLAVGGRLFVTTDDAVQYSDDGTTWSVLPGLTRRWPRSLAVGEGNTLLVGSQGHGFYRTPLPP